MFGKKLDVIGGDVRRVGAGEAYLTRWSTRLFLYVGAFRREELDLGDVRRVEKLTEEQTRSFVAIAAAAGLGALVLGPIGLAAGALASGRGQRIAFGLTLRDGRRIILAGGPRDFLAVCDAIIRRTHARRAQDARRGVDRPLLS